MNFVLGAGLFVVWVIGAGAASNVEWRAGTPVGTVAS